MSTSTTTGAAGGTAAARSPLARAVRHLARTNLVVAAWFGVVMLVLWAGAVGVAAAVTGGDVDISMAQFARQGTIWFPFALAIAVFSGHHMPHIAAGLTRRVLARATLVLAALMTVAYAGVIAVLFALERVLYGMTGWEQRITEDGWFPALPTDVLAVVLLHAVAIAAAQVSGLLVAVVYQRAGAWWGTVALPLTVGPLLLVIAATSGDVRLDALAGFTLPVRLAVSAAAIGVAAAAYTYHVRRIALRPVRT